MTEDWLSRLTEDDGLAVFGSIFTDPDEDDLRILDRVRNTLDCLPPIEADFVDLYFFRHAKQTDIAGIFGVSQPTVCYRLQRAIQRIKYLLEVPQLDVVKLRSDMKGFLKDPMDVDIMVYMYETTCQSATAKKLGVSQGLVRHRFLRTIAAMAKVDSMHFYSEVFTFVSRKLNLLREVKRPIPSARAGFYLDS